MLFNSHSLFIIFSLLLCIILSPYLFISNIIFTFLHIFIIHYSHSFLKKLFFPCFILLIIFLHLSLSIYFVCSLSSRIQLLISTHFKLFSYLQSLCIFILYYLDFLEDFFLLSTLFIFFLCVFILSCIVMEEHNLAV